MPQDSLRSVVYRSFVTCDDPKGVVEGKTIRTSKTDSPKMEGKIETQTLPKSLSRSSSFKRDEKEIMACKSKTTTKELDSDPSSFQLIEVKKGAQELNRVIDSWSKGISFEGQSKDIAKDLLRGALDLQESLMMLGKLQEASQYMAKLKKKQKEKPVEIDIVRIDSDRIDQNQDYRVGFQKPRISVDGSSRDCYEELRNVIRDGLARQNLLPNSSSEKSAYFDRRKLQMSPDIPSTSSSISSMVYSHDFTSSGSLSSRGPEEKPKGSNLIARLMGLEEIPSKTLQPTPRKQMEGNKILDLKRPVFDIDLPMARKPQFVVQKLDRERMTLDEIIEIMQSKGLLKSNKHQSYHFNTSHTEKRFDDDSPPIVIMKPHRPGSEEEFCSHKFINGEKASENEEMPRNRKIKEETLKVKGLNPNGMNMKQHDETSIQKVQQEKGAKDCKEMQAKEEDKEVKRKRKLSSNKMKAYSVPVGPKPQKKEAIEKKVDKNQKMAPVRKKPVEMDNVKSTSVSQTRDQCKVAISKQIKLESGCNTTKNRISQQKSTNSTSTIKRTSSTSFHKSTDRKKNVNNEKPVAGPLATSDEIGRKGEDLVVDLTCKSQSDMTITDATLAVQHINEEEMETSGVLIEELHDRSQTYSLCEATVPTTENENGTETNQEEAIYCGSHDITPRNDSKTRTNHAEMVFDMNACRARVLQRVGSFNDSEIANSRLLLDCANELLENKSIRQILTVHPLLYNSAMKSKFCISEDRLVREVSDGIENLREYGRISKEIFHADTIYGLLERDLWWGRVWSMGWRDGFTGDEVEEVVGDLEKLVLSKLIEEVLVDLCFSFCFFNCSCFVVDNRGSVNRRRES